MAIKENWANYKEQPDAFAGFISIGCFALFVIVVLFIVAIFIIPFLD